MSEVKAQNSISMTSVKAIKDASDEATTLLDGMRQSAIDAGTTLNGIYQVATDAEASAISAQASADSASEYASRAYANLSSVQSITETLNWITAHGTMTLTTDTALDPSHVYFVVDTDGDYVVGGTHYSVVSEPVLADIGTYYELSINESLNNYVATHLVVDTEGLWIIPDAGGNKVLIATGQGSGYPSAGTYIVGDSSVLASFTEGGVEIGRIGSNTIQLTDSYMEVNGEDGNPVFSIGITKTGIYKYSLSRHVEPYAQPPVHDFPTAENETMTYSLNDQDYGAGNVKVYVKVYPISDPTTPIEQSFEITQDGTLGFYNFGNIQSASWSVTISDGEVSATSNVAMSNDVFGVVFGFDYFGFIPVPSMSVGGGNSVSGSTSTAIGIGNVVSGDESVAIGKYNVVSGDEALASGYEVVVGNHRQTVIGRWNDNQSDTAFEIGNGTSGTARSNALTVDWSGNVVASGDVTDGNGNVLSDITNYLPLTGGTLAGALNGTDITASGDVTSVNAYLQLDTTATSGTDKEIYDALVSLGWDSDVIV